ncbi:MAG: BlaI/MecI/CopY family transcriptional regulator [Planctomycetota bacterium]
MQLNESEWTVMQAIWSGGRSARDVHLEVEPETGWTYSTVRTLLKRLVAKRALAEALDGRQLTYRALVTREVARRSALRSLLDRAFGGAFGSLVQHMAEAERLSPAERSALQRLLAAQPESRRKRR